jgi:hypothetical protein
MRHSEPQFYDNLKLRQAALYAIDREALAKAPATSGSFLIVKAGRHGCCSSARIARAQSRV